MITMNTVIEQWNIDNYTVLLLDQYTPTRVYRFFLIDGVKYEPVPIYDITNAIAIYETGNFVGRRVDYIM